MSGNVKEWVGKGDVRGGHFDSYYVDAIYRRAGTTSGTL
jgi:hypothetical protein